MSSGATPASRTEGERSETEVKAAGVVACSELFGGDQNSHALVAQFSAYLNGSIFKVDHYNALDC